MKVASLNDVIMNVGVVIPAAGGGSRFGGEKQFKNLGDREVILHSLRVFLEIESIAQIAIAVSNERLRQFTDIVRSLPGGHKVLVVEGGDRRQDSVFAALNALGPESEIICIHDAARPFVTPKIICDCIDACKSHDGAVTALPITDTVKIVKPGSTAIEGTRDRSDLWGAQTPQVFQRNKLEHAIEYAMRENISATDESFLMEKQGYKICIVPGSPDNIKITRPEDWKLAEAILESRND